MAYVDTFLKIARKDTENYLANDGSLSNIKMAILDWLKITTRLNKKLENEYRQNKNIGKYQKITEGILVKDIKAAIESYEKILNSRKKIKQVQTLSEIEEHFKKGYELLHRIREIFTKQTITYSILVSSEVHNSAGNQLFEATLSLEEILPRIKLNIENVTNNKYSQILSSSSLYLPQTNLNTLQKIIKNLQNVIHSIDRASLWDSLVEFRNFNKMNINSVNFGRLYEVYTTLRKTKKYQSIQYITQGGRYNTGGLANHLYRNANAYQLITENLDQIPGWQQGDFLSRDDNGKIQQTQLKAIFNAQAGVISLNSLQKQLNNIYIALNQNIAKDISNSLIEIFTPQENKIKTEIEKAAKEEAIVNINNSILSANMKLTK